MELSLDQLRELVFDYNSEDFIDIFWETRQMSEHIGSMINSTSPEFIDVIISNVSFYSDRSQDDDGYLSD